MKAPTTRFGIAKRIVAIAAAGAIAAATLVGLAGCSGTSQGSAGGDTITIGVRDDIMNFGFQNEKTGTYYGLEIDLANELADRLGYDAVEFVTVTPDSRNQMLLDGSVDCVVACYSVADSRLENFDFSPVYYTDDTVVMVENSSLITSLEDLAGDTFGIMEGSNAGPLLAIELFNRGIIGEEVISNTDTETVYTNANVLKYLSYEEVSNALEEGEVDAAVMDGSIANTYMNKDRSLLDVSISEQNYAVATQKGSALSQPVADAVQSMLDDGTIAALIDKWN